VLTGSITDQEANVLWDNLTEIPFDENALVVADVSGSMSGMPINVCISLALYLSQNAKGIYKDSFITFSEKPELVELTGTTFTDKVKQLISAAWGMNTNLRMVFEKVLSAAINSHLSPAEMIKTLYIISDMQFDEGLSDTPDESLFGELKEMFNSHGYALPKLVYWNVAADHKFPVINNEPNTVMISGFSPNIIRYINEGILTPEQMMLDVINSERYSVIEI
jgi:hypothetical protein